MSNKELPEYESPPLNEVVMDVIVAPLGLQVPHFGLFWDTIRREYPEFEVKPPASRQVDSSAPQPQSMQLELADPNWVRCWFLDKTKTQLVQLQNDRLITNWRRVDGDEVYPRYHQGIRPQFLRAWNSLEVFAKAIGGIAEPKPISCELLYINQIPLDEGVSGQTMLASWSGITSEQYLPQPKDSLLRSVYEMGDEGVLTVAAFPAINVVTQQKLLQLRLQADGRPRSSTLESALEWFDKAHEWIVRGFTDVTTPEMHKKWGRVFHKEGM